MSTRAWQPRCAASCPRYRTPALYCPPATATCWPRSRIACASVWRARCRTSSGPPGSLSRRSAWPRSRRAGTRSSPRQSTCLSGASRPPPSSTRIPEPHWARLRTTNSLERLHTEIKPSDPERRVVPSPDRASALRLITAVALRKLLNNSGANVATWIVTLLEPKDASPRQPNRSIVGASSHFYTQLGT